MPWIKSEAQLWVSFKAPSLERKEFNPPYSANSISMFPWLCASILVEYFRLSILTAKIKESAR